MNFVQATMTVYLPDIYSGKHIKVSPGAGLAHGSAAKLVGAGHPVVFAAAQHQVAKAVANVRVLVLVWRVPKALLASPDRDPLEVVATGQ